VKSTARKIRWRYALGGAAAIAGLLLAGCSTTGVPVNASITSAYSTTSVQPSVPARTQPKKSRVVTASRYDRGLAGNCTSNGESYDPKSLTAASRTLPLGSTVKVTNVSNGRSVNVRVNDRGPYVSGRSLDLSGGAAEKIGLGDKGVAKVKITPQQAAASPAVPPPRCD
jgi:rare lipoprotein A (peptidoglycan hydrolase)